MVGRAEGGEIATVVRMGEGRDWKIWFYEVLYHSSTGSSRYECTSTRYQVQVCRKIQQYQVPGSGWVYSSLYVVGIEGGTIRGRGIGETVKDRFLFLMYYVTDECLYWQERPYQHDSTASRLLSEVKHVRAWLVLRWGTTLESQVLFFCYNKSHIFHST